MKITRNLLTILIAVLIMLLSGCTAYRYDILTPDEYTEQDILTPDEYTESVYFVSASISDGIYNYTYSGNYVKLNYEYCIDGARSFGLKVMCDGVETPFYTNFDRSEKLLHIIKNDKPGTPVSVEIYFVPIGNKNETVSVDIVDIVEPDFDFSALDTEHLHPLIWGRKFTVGHISGIYIEMQSDGILPSTELCEEYIFESIPDDVMLDSLYTDENGITMSTLQNLHADSTVNGKESLYHRVKQGEQLNIDITYNGTLGDYIYTCFYIDNELYPAFDGSCYSKAYIDAEHYTRVNVIIDTSTLKKGKHICYSVCSDVPYCSISPHAQFIIEVI